MAEEKETRVYWVNSVEWFEINAGIYTSLEISQWNKTNPLPERALQFIQFAEENGDVLSLEAFINQFNLNRDVPVPSYDYIFITNKY